jgi:serine/threonine-protein kinase
MERLTGYGEPVDGTPFGRYRLIELLGRGGMGEVWRAHDTDTDRIVAIKLLPAHFSDNEEFQRRFRREAHAAAGLNSPHVVPIHHYGEIDGRLYVDMRLIDGRDLASVLAQGPLEPGRAVRIIEHVARALHAAHKVGLVHRDVKPSNILLDEDDYAYLIDFGIARAAGESSLTQTGGFVGSWPYMAPERFSAREADTRADVYALACVLYECLTGDRPYPGDSLEQQYAGHVATPPPQPSSTNPDLPADFDKVTGKGLAKDPDQRYATTVELAHAARDAITVPIPRPIPPTAQPTESTMLEDRTPPAPAPTWVEAASPSGASPPAVAVGPSAPTHSSQPSNIGRRTDEIGQQPAQFTPTQRRPQPSPPRPTGQPSPPQQQPLRPEPNRRSRTPLIIAGVTAVIVLAAASVGIARIVGDGSTPSPRSSQAAPPSESAESSPPAEPSPPGSQVVLPFIGLKSPNSVAVDSSGNLYVTDCAGTPGAGRVLKMRAGSSTQEVLPFKFAGLECPGAVSVDSVGNVYLAGGSVRRLAVGASAPTELPISSLGGIPGVAVDSADTVYFIDGYNHQVWKLPAGATTPSAVPFAGLNGAKGVAVDKAANIYVVNFPLPQQVALKLPAGSSAQEVLPFTFQNGPENVAVDTNSTVYVTAGTKVLKLPAGATTQTELAFNGLKQPSGLAVDRAGSVYVADYQNNQVLRLPAQ